MDQPTSRVSRRAFMRAAGLGVASTAAMGAVTVAQAETIAWDGEADVVIVGSGGAALSAACGVVDNGGTAILLEKAGFIGGTTVKSGGGYTIPNNHKMREAGLGDDYRTYLQYAARVSYPELYRANDEENFGLTPNNKKLFDAWWEHGPRIIEKLDTSGALPATMYLSWDGKPGPDYHGHLPENGNILGRQLAPRVEGRPNGFGGDMVKYLNEYATAGGAQTHLNHRVTKILQDETGRVIGVEADNQGTIKRFKAIKGVIFGSGGFTHNKEMAHNYQRNPSMGGCAAPTNEGDLVYMATAIGAKLGAMNEAWNQQVVLDQVLQFSSVPGGIFFLGGDSAIAVNKHGKRMYDEKYVYPERTRAHYVYDQWTGDYPNLYQIFVFDEAARNFGGYFIPGPGANIPDYVVQGNTLEELAANVQAKFDSFADQIGPYPLDPNFVENLKAEIARFNGFAETGKDLDFHRGESPIVAYFHDSTAKREYPNPYMAPISAEGPYYAFLMAPGALDTKGGPVYNEFGQVLSAADAPIEGLYVAGNCGASPSGKTYFGAGATLGLAITFGYRAAEHAMGVA